MQMNMRISIIYLLALSACGGGGVGPAGATGAQGERGLQGSQGSAGASGETISSGIGCAKVDAGSGVSVLLVYESVVYSTGDRFVSGSVAGTGVQPSGSEVYKASQLGATTGSMTIVADIDAASSGAWTFTSQAGVTKAVYNDGTNAHNGYTYTFVTVDCTTF